MNLAGSGHELQALLSLITVHRSWAYSYRQGSAAAFLSLFRAFGMSVNNSRTIHTTAFFGVCWNATTNRINVTYLV
jgi:hypothetical protein